ncbi:hypothetical protein [Bacillus mycoides]|uniref:hypothetical protein n=1 Tax=Bacillus mycoides TaxID=1405 RepID=UPI00065B86D7|nr:hypothetical protein [Bacillus mycoides]KMQ15280.1 hypothetical protein TU70_19150 [Bacillus mycoides]
MVIKKQVKSMSLSIDTITKLNEEKNGSALIQNLLDEHYEKQSKSYEQKMLELQIIGLDTAIKSIFGKYVHALDINEHGEFTESEHSLLYMEQLKHMKSVFFIAYDGLSLNYLRGEALKSFISRNRIGFSASDFPFERIRGRHHENDWEVLKYIHCLHKYFSKMRYFVRSQDEEAKQFVIIFANADLHVNILAIENDSIDYARAYKRYYDYIHFSE